MKEIKKILHRYYPTKKNENLNKLHYIFAFVYSVQLVALIALGGSKWVSISTNYLAYDSLLSNNWQVIHSAGASRLFDINIAWILILAIFVSIVIHLLLGKVIYKKYIISLKTNPVISKWLVYGVVSTVMTLLLLILGGVYDISTLILAILIAAFTAVFGVFYQLVLRNNKDLAKYSRLSTIIVAISPWIVIGIYVLGTLVFGGNSINAFVYWVYLTFLLSQIGFLYMLKKSKISKGKWSTRLYQEQTFYGLIFVLQTLIIWQVYFGCLR